MFKAKKYFNKNLTNSEYKEVIRLSLPIILSHFIEVLFPFFNTHFAAKLGKTELASLAIANTSFITLMGFGWGMITIVGINTSEMLGKNLFHRIGINLKASILSISFLAIIIMYILSNMDNIWHYFKQDEEVVRIASLYIDGILWAVIPDFFKYAIFQYCINLGFTRVILITHIIFLPVLFIVNNYFIWQYQGHGLGMYGLGIGSAITYWLMFIVIFIYIIVQKNIRQSLLVKFNFIEYQEVLKKQFIEGVPIGLMVMLEILFFSVVALFLGVLGKDFLAAFQICNQWIHLFIITTYGFSEVVAILVSRSFAANNIQKVIAYYKISFKFALIAPLIGLIICIFLPETLIAFDIDIYNSQNKEVVSITKTFFIYNALILCLDTVRIILTSALRGMNFSSYALKIGVISFWALGLPLSYFLAFILKLGAIGIFASIIIIMVVNIIFAQMKFNSIIAQEKLIT